ncbi:hypothetical protein CRG98_020350 [Punica granatum]|uniref:Secreted protein n=1 Tax=Punica granatum TaxID=22663 RepID=A0A2I0JTP6_PUNGR|nr:hypothetical protein CRG98_020350 [Punica granatum]
MALVSFFNGRSLPLQVGLVFLAALTSALGFPSTIVPTFPPGDGICEPLHHISMPPFCYLSMFCSGWELVKKTSRQVVVALPLSLHLGSGFLSPPMICVFSLPGLPCGGERCWFPPCCGGQTGPDLTTDLIGPPSTPILLFKPLIHLRWQLLVFYFSASSVTVSSALHVKRSRVLICEGSSEYRFKTPLDFAPLFLHYSSFI